LNDRNWMPICEVRIVDKETYDFYNWKIEILEYQKLSIRNGGQYWILFMCPGIKIYSEGFYG
jgi:hypothetical protein